MPRKSRSHTLSSYADDRHAGESSPLSASAALDALVPALRRLDDALTLAVVEAERRFGEAARGDFLRGVRITRDDIARLLSRDPCELLFGAASAALLRELEYDVSPLGRLGRVYGLTHLELAVVLVAVAPEIDLRYERIYAYLQDDVTRRRPSIDLILDLLCPTSADKLARRGTFAPNAPLVRHGIVDLAGESSSARAGLLNRQVRVDEQVVRFLVGDDALDERLSAACRESIADLPEERAAVAALFSPLESLGRRDAPSRVYVCASDAASARQAAESLAATSDRRTLLVDVGRAPAERDVAESWAAILLREARLRRLHLIVVAGDSPASDTMATLLDAAASHPEPITLVGTYADQGAEVMRRGVSTVALPRLDAWTRADVWRAELRRSGMPFTDERVCTIAQRYRLSAGQIAEVVAIIASSRALPRIASARSAPTNHLDDATVRHAVRTVCGRALAAVAERIDARPAWDDLVLPADALSQLRELCGRVRQSERVYDDWGFQATVHRGMGISALFSGGSGTGKTMAAEVVAGALELDLYRVDLARVVSKYIGETEKNLDRVFTAAAHSNAVLLFDEADALFGKRSEVSDAHDRYANIEIAYLLQRIEAYDGVAILTTNLADHLDDAFTRRLTFAIHFPFPDESARHSLWKRAWPATVDVASDVDRAALAREIRLAGGSIRNVALGAAFHAAEDGGVVHDRHIRHALRREMQKLGQPSAVTT